MIRTGDRDIDYAARQDELCRHDDEAMREGPITFDSRGRDVRPTEGLSQFMADIADSPNRRWLASDRVTQLIRQWKQEDAEKVEGYECMDCGHTMRIEPDTVVTHHGYHDSPPDTDWECPECEGHAVIRVDLCDACGAVADEGHMCEGEQ